NKWRSEYNKLINQYGLFDDARSKQLRTFNPFENSSVASFYDNEVMFGVSSGFDIVIGNPPYLLEGRAPKSYFEKISYYQGKMDIWYSFACLGIDHLNKGGVLSFIATNNWLTNYGAKIMRNKVITETKIKKIIDFNNSKVFNSADIQTMILVLTKETVPSKYEFDYRKIKESNSNKNIVEDILNYNENSNIIYLTPLIEKEKDKISTLTFSEYDDLLNKISHEGEYLNVSEINQGIVFPQSDLNKKNAEILGEQYNQGDGVFVISDYELKIMNLSKEESDLIKPYFTSEQIKVFQTNPKNKYWVIYTNSSFNKLKSMDSFPNLKKHLDQFQSIISSDNKPYGLHRARKEEIFKGEKIIVKRKSANRPVFSYSDFDTYVSQTFNIIKTNKYNNKYLTGLFNSKLISFWLNHKGKMQGDNYQLDKGPLMEIPIKKSEKQNEIINLVNQLLGVYETKLSLEEIEQEINSLIYETYNLNKAEIEIIENYS